MNPSDTIRVAHLAHVNHRALAAINSLLPQLNPSVHPLTLDGLQLIVQSPANTVYVAVDQATDVIVGMLLVVTVHQFVGTKCWIEDVVVSSDFRGRGIAKQLLTSALSEMPKDVKHVNLTSNPRREAAQHLYTTLGFTPRDTVVFRRTPIRNVKQQGE